MNTKLPPLPDEAFDGEKYSVELKNKKCDHKDVTLNGNVIFCKACGAEWSGPNIGALWQAFKERDGKKD